MESVNKENIHPVGDRLLLEVYKTAEKVGNFELAESDGYATPVVGEVIRAGEGAQYRAGQTVMFRRYSVDSVKLFDSDGTEKEFYILEGSQVIAEVKQGVEKKEDHYKQIKQRKALKHHANGTSREDEKSSLKKQ